MNILRNKHKMQNYSREYLLSHGFRYRKASFTDDIDVYTYRFPVYKYNKQSLIDCTLTVNPNDGDVFISVTQQDGCIYTPFYANDYGNFRPIMEIINSNILHQFSKLSISVVNEE